MALDLGEKRIGVAFSDELRLTAKGHSVIRRKSRLEDFERYRRLIAEKGVTLLVVGLPVTLGGTEGEKAAWVRDYVAELEQQVDVPVTLWDESLTTLDARNSLLALGRRGKRLREHLDAEAAAHILRSYLAAHL